MTWRELNREVESRGLADLDIGALHVTIDPDEVLIMDDVQIYQNAKFTLTIANGCCG